MKEESKKINAFLRQSALNVYSVLHFRLALVPHGISHVTTRQAVSLLSLVSPGQSQKKDIPTLDDYIGVSQSALVPTEVVEMRTRTSSLQPSASGTGRQMLRRKSFELSPSFLPAIIPPSFNPPRRREGAGR